MNPKFPHTEEGATKMAEYLKERLRSQGLEKYKLEQWKVSTIFLAGAPWAGKTEFIESINDPTDENRYIVLDTDEYRCLFEGYLWHNASEFQKLASRVMDKMYAFCMKEWLRVIMDWTFAAQRAKIDQNIEQCAKRERLFAIALVYQDPVISYLYTKVREAENTRSVPFDDFIRKYFDSIENTFRIAKEYPFAVIRVAIKRKWSRIPIVRSNIRTKESFYSTLAKHAKIDRKESLIYTEDKLREELLSLEERISKVPKNALKLFLLSLL